MGTRASAVLPLLLLAAGAAGAGGTGEEEALARFRRAYGDGSASVRRKAVGILEELPGPRATAALLPALADPSPRVRERARDALARRTGEEEIAAVAGEGLRSREAEVRRRSADHLRRAGEGAAPHGEALASLLRDREPLVRESAAAALGAAGSRDRAPAVAAALAREGAPEVRGALILALDRLDGEAAAEAAARLLRRERDGPPCVAALAVLSHGDPAAAREAARPLLRHGRWEVRLAAAAALGSLGEGAADVDALLRALDGEKRLRVREGIGAGLEALTGAPFGDDLERWEAWWETRRSSWRPPEGRGRGGGDAPPRRRGAAGESAARFYDIPVDGDRVAFVLDTSRSMADPARIGEEASKMEVALARAAKTFAALRSDVSFNVVAFGTEVEAWKPRAVPASSTARYEALRFLQGRPLEGRTNILDALAAAMADPEVDTVFLLTDGAPTEGEATGRRAFLEELAFLRRWRPVRVHCVEVGASNTGRRWRGFLAEVAAACGGVHAAPR